MAMLACCRGEFVTQTVYALLDADMRSHFTSARPLSHLCSFRPFGSMDSIDFNAQCGSQVTVLIKDKVFRRCGDGPDGLSGGDDGIPKVSACRHVWGRSCMRTPTDQANESAEAGCACAPPIRMLDMPTCCSPASRTSLSSCWTTSC
jgi:hypothetical protein